MLELVVFIIGFTGAIFLALGKSFKANLIFAICNAFSIVLFVSTGQLLLVYQQVAYLIVGIVGVIKNKPRTVLVLNFIFTETGEARTLVTVPGIKARQLLI